MISSRSNIVGRAKIVGPPQRFNFNLGYSYSEVFEDSTPIFLGGSNVFNIAHSRLYSDEQFFPETPYKADVDSFGNFSYSVNLISRKSAIISANIQIVGNKSMDGFTFHEVIKSQPYLIKNIIVSLAGKDSQVIPVPPKGQIFDGYVGCFDIDGTNTRKDKEDISGYYDPKIAINKVFIPCNIIVNSNSGFFFSRMGGVASQRNYQIELEAYPINL